MAKAPKKKPPAMKPKLRNDQVEILALGDEHFAIMDYDGSDGTRRYVITDNHMPFCPVSATIGHDDDPVAVIERLMAMRVV